MSGSQSAYALACPFCNFEDHDYDFLFQHINLLHPENNDAPYFIKDHEKAPPAVSPSATEGASEWVECSCGECCLLVEFSDHLDLHGAESFDDADATGAGLRTISSSTTALVSTMVTDRGGRASTDSDLSRPPTSIPDSTLRYIGNNVQYKEGCSQLPHDNNAMRLSAKNPTETLVAECSPAKPSRLGRAELGPYHNEKRMPSEMRALLEKGGKVSITDGVSRDGRLLQIQTISNEVHGIIPVLAQCCAQDNGVSRAYFCHPDVTNVFKLSKEGGFCGYRNIQIMISYIQQTRSEGYQGFTGRLPSVLQLQDMIEHAWDLGINESCRIETGGIRGTRKYIGTPEAQALFLSLGISCTADAFSDRPLDDAIQPKHPSLAMQRLFEAVEYYFLSSDPNLSKRVSRTSLPPIYFQQPGHSMTIVGLEKMKNGSCNLLVLDPMYKPSPAISKLIGTHFRVAHPGRLLKAHRRGVSYLKRYQTFEILRLLARVPPKAKWDGT